MAQDEPKIPGYDILRKLGRGGMATVFLATQKPINRHVALKVMSNQLGEDSVWAKRFIHEAQVIAQLTHPNVVPVYDVGTHEGRFYISMEYLPGGSLKRRMSEGIGIPDTLKIVVGIAAGLDFAGEKGFVHRDIKPDNIMFRADGAPVILDFGIVKQMDDGPSKMTQTGVIVGTTSYMSPEQAQGRELDQRSDIYALGVLFFELLTGRQPFKGETDVATLLQHINQEIPRLPGHLLVFQPLIDKALAKDPFHRYARAREFIDHISQLEPQIKAALTRLKSVGSEDATVVQAAIKPAHDDPDATAVYTKSHSSSDSDITTEEELTQVLSSAKATIRDFSVEARQKKARQTRRAVIAMSCCAIMAMFYVGYHQLYVVPQERAAAEAKILEAELKTRNKINDLLAQARDARRGLVAAELDRVDELIALYRQVLKLDPENKEAQFVLEKFGLRYIDMAKNAVKRRDLSKASTYRDYAEQLVPLSPDIADIRGSIKALRAEQIDRELVQEEVDTLISIAQADFTKSGSFSDFAYTKLKQALRLDPENTQASGLMGDMLQGLYNKTQKDIARGRISRARENLEILGKYYDDPAQLSALSESLDDRSSQLAKKQSISRLLTQAQRLMREKRSITVNDQLRDAYLDILKLDPQSKEAKQGLINTSDFDAKLAREAIAERDFSRAQRQASTVERFTPSYSGLPQLKTDIAFAERAVDQANILLTDAKTLIAKDKNVDEKRQSLLAAFNKIDDAKKLDPANPAIDDALAALETEYVITIKGLIANKKASLANAYFDDASNKHWPSDRILQLQIAQQSAEKKPKPKRVITGGF